MTPSSADSLRTPATPSEAAAAFEVDDVLTDTVDRLLGEHCDHETVQAAEDNSWAAELWQTFSDAGFAAVSTPEVAGGFGGRTQDALEVLRLVGYHAAPLPVAEHDLLGGWLCGATQPPVATTAEPMTVAQHHDVVIDGNDAEVRLCGTATHVPWASVASSGWLLGERADDTCVAVRFALADAEVRPRRNMAGEPRDDVTFNQTPATAYPVGVDVTPATLELRGALSRVALMAGALVKMSRLTVSYTNERIQFGRPVARFQAVQQHLVWAAQDAALVEMAAAQAGLAAASSTDLTDATFEIAAAKLVANQAAARATKACHQAHGAMGMTQEYPLHQLSRRLWSWRKEYGSEARWRRALSPHAVAAGADGLYPLITRT